MLDLQPFLAKHAYKSTKIVPARLQAAMALLERLRDHPKLALSDHWKPGSSGIKSQETYGDRAHERLNLSPINKNHGRRSSNLQEWGQELLDLVAEAGFASADGERRERIISFAQEALAKPLRDIFEEEPFEARIRDRSIEAVIHDLLVQADRKGKSGEVAQYLVGAKLALRFKRDIPVHQANKSDRKSRFDPNARLGDFEIENTVIEVAVGLPDDKHLEQICEILETADSEVWLLTRSDRVAIWKSEISGLEGIQHRRVVVTSVEAFVGQNISELGEFSTKGKAAQLEALFDLYNTKWIDQVGTPGLRIVFK